MMSRFLSSGREVRWYAAHSDSDLAPMCRRDARNCKHEGGPAPTSTVGGTDRKVPESDGVGPLDMEA